MSSPAEVRAPRPLLDALPGEDRRRLLGHGDRIPLAFAQVINRPGRRSGQVFFPIDALIVAIAHDGDTGSLGVALIGAEGMLGASLVLGARAIPGPAIVQATGLAWRIDARDLRHAAARSGPLKRRLDDYLYRVMSELTRTVACTRFHVVEARLARWLLMTRDRARSNQFHLTHEFLADMLGVRRAGITRAASDLQSRRLIEYRRGEITVIDSRGLEDAACSCYAADCRAAQAGLRNGR
jgi:CRP-like cAMP-binding protein